MGGGKKCLYYINFPLNDCNKARVKFNRIIPYPTSSFLPKVCLKRHSNVPLTLSKSRNWMQNFGIASGVKFFLFSFPPSTKVGNEFCRKHKYTLKKDK